MRYKKDIAFIYSDSAEKQIMQPIINEAHKRGYKTNLTDNPFAKTEIGVYCQHKNFPQFSKLSVIMLHDIIQAYSRWPDIWFLEPWHKYDIGILPSDNWVDNWKRCSQYFYTRPRKGMYKVGWPKADFVADIERDKYRDLFYKQYGLDNNKKTVLYAPAWENDGKQNDFVEAMLTLDVNILIKQGPFPEEKYPDICKNIKEMEKMHSGISGITILNKNENIFNAITAADILVSEESSTLCEAILMGIPAISVSNWLIPDVTPSRYPKDDYDFVIKTTKEKLAECVQNTINNYSKYKEEAENYCQSHFGNIGNASVMIMDIIDSYVDGKEKDLAQIQPNGHERLPFIKYIEFCVICVKREITENLCKRIWIINKIYNIYRILMHKPFVPLQKKVDS